MIFKSIGAKDIERAIEKLFTILCIYLSHNPTDLDKFDELKDFLLSWIIKHYQS